MKKKNLKRAQNIIIWLTKHAILSSIAGILLLLGVMLMWFSTVQIPDLEGFNERKLSSSTKIYDKTGEVVLFDIHDNFERVIVSNEEVSPYIFDALVSIEDWKFYEHPGINVRATMRAIIYTILDKTHIRSGGIQGGSTITQQVLKNTLLTGERRISRKLKEWFLAVRLEKVLTKDEIFNHYVNELPYGKSMYGVEQGARSFFKKSALDVTLAEAAYLAAIPNAPTYFSPFGDNTDKLEDRKNQVLYNMKNLGYITQVEYDIAMEEVVEFRAEKELHAKALHFVEYVRSYIEEKYGEDVIESEGYKVVTTLDYELQAYAEEVVLRRALENEEKWGATNQSAVVMDSSNGHILAMVGSRDYSDKDIDGKFNVTLARRQPGSSFKPFIYAAAFEKGFTDNSILFDVATQFSQKCEPDNISSNNGCYAPRNYDGLYKGPLRLREALAQSRNIPAVKLTYLVGLETAARLARAMGVTSLGDVQQYGLTLVLGGGEVSLLQMVGAYSVFSQEGTYNPSVFIQRIEDQNGVVLEQFKPAPRQVLSPDSARRVNDILSDNVARTPLFGSQSFLYFGEGASVAGKTGTTNNNKDAWLVGYTGRVAVGVWSGNNDNTPMKKGSSISGYAWREIMMEAKRLYPGKRFTKPETKITGKPFLDGVWLGGDTFEIDTVSKKLATQYTPEETRSEIVQPNIHSALHWISRSDPTGTAPESPESQSLYRNWEFQVNKWATGNGLIILNDIDIQAPTEFDDVHGPEFAPEISIKNVILDSFDLEIEVDVEKKKYPLKHIEYFVNGEYMDTTTPNQTTIILDVSKYLDRDSSNLRVRAMVVDEIYNKDSIQYEYTFSGNGRGVAVEEIIEPIKATESDAISIGETEQGLQGQGDQPETKIEQTL